MVEKVNKHIFFSLLQNNPEMPFSPPQPRTRTCSHLHGHICEITTLPFHVHFPGAFSTEISHAGFAMGGIRDSRGGRREESVSC